MQGESIFGICNLIAMTGWLLLSVAPRWRWTHLMVSAGLIPLLLGLIYFYLIVRYFGTAEGGFGSLSDVMKLFSDPNAVLAGWIHYLAFDLFVGSWELRDGQYHQISHWLLLPCLFLTFMFGPVGLVCYFIIRWVKTKKFLHENFSAR